ncbi:MAG: DNA adenine methylase [Anaerolineae bacterium]
MSGPAAPLRWFGGKWPLVGKLLPLIPAHHTYVEAFGGGAALLLSKQPSPVEVYNDIDQNLVNFFKVLADEAAFARFLRKVQATPVSRALYYEFLKSWHHPDPVEQAYRWFVVARQSFSGRWGEGWGHAVTTSSRRMAASTADWLACVEGLPQIHARLMRVQIECLDWREALETYDTAQTFFYLDPPYLPETRKHGGYAHELTSDDHRELVGRLLGIQGKAMLSGYNHAIYQSLERAGWTRHDFAVTCHSVGHTRLTGLQGTGTCREKHARTESVWLSPNCLGQARQLELSF